MTLVKTLLFYRGRLAYDASLVYLFSMPRSPDRDPIDVLIDHCLSFSWGEFAVSLGAATLLDLEPLPPGERTLTPFSRVPAPSTLVHPPLEILMATTREARLPSVRGVQLGVSSNSGDDVWKFGMAVTEAPRARDQVLDTVCGIIHHGLDAYILPRTDSLGQIVAQSIYGAYPRG